MDGYWEFKGSVHDSLPLVLDQISKGCGLNVSFVMTNSGDGGAFLDHYVGREVCESLRLSASWDQGHLSQFDPESSNTMFSILRSVSSTRHCVN